MTFCTHIAARFGDEDHAQVVYYPRFFDYFHRAFEDLFDQRGGGYRSCVVDHRVGWPVVHAKADFHQPLRFGQQLRLELTAEAVGERSVRLHYVGRHAASQAPIVTGEVSVVCVELPAFKSQPIPRRYRKLFAGIQRPASKPEGQP